MGPGIYLAGVSGPFFSHGGIYAKKQRRFLQDRQKSHEEKSKNWNGTGKAEKDLRQKKEDVIGANLQICLSGHIAGTL